MALSTIASLTEHAAQASVALDRLDHDPPPGDPDDPPGHAPEPSPLPDDPPGPPVQPDVPQPEDVPRGQTGEDDGQPLVVTTATSVHAPPHDGDANQGGTRPAGLPYQEDLGVAQDA